MLEVPKLHFRRSDAFPKDTASAAESRVCTQRRCSSQGAPLPEDGEGAGAWSPEECPMEKQSGCRHAAIAKYFGDLPPACTKGCDCCQNPAGVRKQLDALEQRSSWNKTCIGPSQGNGYDPELYEGGRRGYGGFSRYDEGSGGSGDEGRDEAQKREWNLFYQKQMRLRKGKDPKTEEFIPPDEDCPLREAASRKIPRLTVKAREHCLGLLEEALSSNHQAAGSADGLDLQAKAVELEHETFRSAKVANLYKASVLKKVAEIHRASKEGQLYCVGGSTSSCSAQAEPPEPTEHDILPASQVYSLKPKRVGAGFPKGSCLFQTATELMEKTWVPEQEPRPEQGGEQGGEQGAPSQPCDRQGTECAEPLPGLRGEAPRSDAVCRGPSPEEERGPARGSPTAKVRVNKKQQLLAAAALKDSQNITRFFCRRTKSPPPLTAALGADSTSPSRDGVWRSLTLLEKGSGQEDGAVGRLAARPDTKECAEEGPSACPLRDQRPPEGQPSPTEEAQRGKRPRPQQENAGSQAQKRPRPSAKASILAEAKGSVSASDQRPPSPQGSCQLSAPSISLKEAASVVVKCLTPFYKEGKFASKELFKAFARHLSHSLTQNLCPGRSVKEEAQDVIKQLFRGRARCESEADWHGLCGLQR